MRRRRRTTTTTTKPRGTTTTITRIKTMMRKIRRISQGTAASCPFSRTIARTMELLSKSNKKTNIVPTSATTTATTNQSKQTEILGEGINKKTGGCLGETLIRQNSRKK